jgi:hypothetical protein
MSAIHGHEVDLMAFFTTPLSTGNGADSLPVWIKLADASFSCMSPPGFTTPLQLRPKCLDTTDLLFILVPRDRALWQRPEPILHTEFLAVPLLAGQ